mmetsp:Transcript_33415/g.79667  ORF Transcript_33415/g.79667 Transcript_33415/m.79667 type:complete len:256 (+) Transcript_33415:1167-1934(+)
MLIFTGNLSPLLMIAHDGSTRYRSRAVVRILIACGSFVLFSSTSTSSAITRLLPTCLVEPGGSRTKHSFFCGTSTRVPGFVYRHVTTCFFSSEGSRASHHCCAASPRMVASVTSLGASQLLIINLSFPVLGSAEKSLNSCCVSGVMHKFTLTRCPGARMPELGVVENRSLEVVRILKAHRLALLFCSASTFHTDCCSAGSTKSNSSSSGSLPSFTTIIFQIFPLRTKRTLFLYPSPPRDPCGTNAGFRDGSCVHH